MNINNECEDCKAKDAVIRQLRAIVTQLAKAIVLEYQRDNEVPLLQERRPRHDREAR